MKNENYLLTLQKIIPLYYEDVQSTTYILCYSCIYYNNFLSKTFQYNWNWTFTTYANRLY